MMTLQNVYIRYEKGSLVGKLGAVPGLKSLSLLLIALALVRPVSAFWCAERGNEYFFDTCNGGGFLMLLSPLLFYGGAVLMIAGMVMYRNKKNEESTKTLGKTLFITGFVCVSIVTLLFFLGSLY